MSEAFWRRMIESGVSIVETLRSGNYRPESADETAIWTEITAPHNYAALLKYFEYKSDVEIGEDSKKLFDMAREEALRRIGGS